MDEMLLRNLEFRYPSIIQNMKTYRSISYYELIIETTDDERYLYDDEWGTLRKLPADVSEMSSEDLSMEFGYTLKRLMRRKEINQKTLAELSGVTQTSISLYINGKRSPTLSTLHKLSRILDCDIEELVHIE